jgi:GWxTD domain-containing protein
MSRLLLTSAPWLIHSLGWTLLHFCWQGTVIAILLWCALSLLTGRSPQIRYIVACCALLLMVIFPIFTFAHIAAASRSITYPTRNPATWNPAISLNNNFGGPMQPWLDRIAQSLDHSMPLVFSLWLAGVVIFLLRLNLGLIVARRMKSVATTSVPHELQLLFQDLSHRLGITRPISLLGSAIIQVPTVVGWLRPVVLMPIGCLSGLSTIQIEAILAHELAHIRRHDYLVSVLQSTIEALLFYHPVVWWVSKQLRKEREYCCDDLSVRITGNSLAYAKALSALEEQRSSTYITALGANGGVLAMRIKRLLGYKEDPAVSQLATFTVLALIVLASGLWIGAIAHAQSQSAPSINPLFKPTSNSQALQNIPTEYQNWISQDVVWIITPQESEAFANLKNNEERDHFIAQFWQRRNTPGSAPDSYRVEHYHRIAYSNQHFAVPQTPGWKSDRGHVFIAYGLPDSIDAHAAGDKTSGGNPWEVWHYSSLEGVGQNIDMKFVDICNCGDYRLQTLQGNSLTISSK